MPAYDAIRKLCGLVKREETVWEILDIAVDHALIGAADAIKIMDLLGLDPREGEGIPHFDQTPYGQSVRLPLQKGG